MKNTLSWLIVCIFILTILKMLETSCSVAYLLEVCVSCNDFVPWGKIALKGSTFLCWQNFKIGILLPFCSLPRLMIFIPIWNLPMNCDWWVTVKDSVHCLVSSESHKMLFVSNGLSFALQHHLVDKISFFPPLQFQIKLACSHYIQWWHILIDI